MMTNSKLSNFKFVMVYLKYLPININLKVSTSPKDLFYSALLKCNFLDSNDDDSEMPKAPGNDTTCDNG